MNLFRIVLLDVILLTFPILIYLVYLNTDKSINERTKLIYLRFSLLTSFLMLYNYGIEYSKPISILIFSSIVIFCYLEDLYIFANILLISIIAIYNISLDNILFILIGDSIISLLYVLKRYKKISNIVFIELCVLVDSIIYFVWVYMYDYKLFNIEFLFTASMSYLFIINVICLIYETGKKILQSHMNYKELLKEKQIRLSLFKITHEIKNPIAVCKGYLDMINVRDSKQVERYVPIIKSEIERLLTLLQDFLLINKSNLDLDIMDFNLLIEDTLYKLNPLLEDNNIKLNVNILDDEIFIKGDYNRLSQVLINIIKNSIEAKREGKEGKINISTKIKDNNYIVLVEDNGVGMDKETLSKMKNPFYTTKKRGSGLGVSLIYEIIEAHNGKVEYSSEYGKGTKVTLKLPLYE